MYYFFLNSCIRLSQNRETVPLFEQATNYFKLPELLLSLFCGQFLVFCMQYLCLVNRPQKVLWKVTKYIHFYPAFRGVLAYVPPFVCRTLSDNAVQLKIWSTYLCTTWFSIWGLWIINTTQNVCFPIDVSYVTQHYNTTSTWHTFVFGRLVSCRRESKWPYSLEN